MPEDKGNTAVPQGGPGDRVAMLSLNRDGTPDQHDPELIGDKEFAEAATREQFRQQAVSAVDDVRRPEVLPGTEAAGEVEQDPSIAELKDAHDKAAEAADKAAERTVSALFTEPTEKPAVTSTTTPAARRADGGTSRS